VQRIAHCLLLVGCLTTTGGLVLGQQPTGEDISSAIPIVFGQSIDDIGDKNQAANRVYRITLARGQEVSVVASTTATNISWWAGILAPDTGTVRAQIPNGQILARGTNFSVTGEGAMTLRYQVPAAGTYYILLRFNESGMRYNLRATATGTPIAVPNPPSAGCLTGRVDSITYSLQFIGMGLPDEVSIGGTRACASCTVKPPLYTEIASRLEEQMRSNADVEACYDAAGNIFQLKLLRP